MALNIPSINVTSTPKIYPAGQGVGDTVNEERLINRLIEVALSGARTAIPVRVSAVYGVNSLSAIGRLDITPLVQQIDSSGNAVSHGTIYNVPYLRITGGVNAIICDPPSGMSVWLYSLIGIYRAYLPRKKKLLRALRAKTT